MILLDTNVVSELLKFEPNPGVKKWAGEQVVETLYLSSITLAEMRAGVEVLPRGKRRSFLREKLEHGVFPMFTGRILSFDQHCSVAYAEQVAICRKKGTALSKSDALIAAIAATNVMTVATRDTRPFVASEVAVINPWDLVNA